MMRIASIVVALVAALSASTTAFAKPSQLPPSPRAAAVAAITVNGSWTTYHHDNGHTGFDPLAPAIGTVAPTVSWTENTLDEQVYAEPLIYRGLVYAATLNNTVYALNQSTGAIVWRNNLGAPEMSGGGAATFRLRASSALQVFVPSRTVIKSFTFAPPPPAYVSGAVGTDNELWVLHSGSPTWTPDSGVLLGAPAIVAVPQTIGPASPHYIATASDHSLWVRNDTLPWQVLSSSVSCIDNPAGVVIAGTLYLACQGADNALWHVETPAPTGTSLPTTVNGWQWLGGILFAGPAVANVAGKPTYFVIGTGQQVFSRELSSGYMGQPWSCIGHPAVATFTTTSYFACHGTDGSLWYSTNTGSGWSSAQSLGGALVDGVGLAAISTGPVFFAEGTNGNVWQRTIITGWTSDGAQVQLGLAASAL